VILIIKDYLTILMKKLTIFLLFFIFLAGLGWGQQTFIWQGGTDDNWTTHGNWTVGGNPASEYPGEISAGDTATINAGANIIFNAVTPYRIDTITIANASIVITLNAALHADHLSNNGTINLNANVLDAGTLTNNGTIELTGNAGQLNHTNVSGTVHFTGAGATLSGITHFHHLIIDSGARALTGVDVFVSGDFTISGGSLSCASISVTENSVINAAVTTTGGAQTYLGQITLGAAINAGAGGSVTFGTSANSAGTIIQNAGIITTANLSIYSNSSVTLNQNNAVTALTVTGAGGAVEFHNAAALSVDLITTAARNVEITTTTGGITLTNNVTAGTLHLTSAGIINQTGGIITTTGALTLAATGAITLNDANNVNTLTVTGAGNNVNFTNNATLSVGAITAAGHDVHITTTGSAHNISLTGAIEAGTLHLTSTGTITQTGSAAITAGTLSLSADGVITLNNAGNSVNTLTVTHAGNNLSFTNAAALSVGAIPAAGHTVQITTNGSAHNISLTGAIEAVTLNLTSTGTITQTGSAEITAGTLSLSAEGVVTLNNVNNSVNALTVTHAGNNVNFTNNAALSVGAIAAAGHDVHITTTGSAHNISLTGAVTAGTLTLTSAGMINQSGGTVTAGTLSLSAAGGGITINNAGNSVGALTVTGTDDNVTFRNAAALSVGAIAAGGHGVQIITTGANTNNITLTGAVTAETLTLTSAGAINQTGGTVTTAGTLTLAATGGGITLGSANNVNTLTITGAGGAVEFRNAAALSVGAVTTATRNVEITTTTGGITLTNNVTAGTLHLTSAGIINQTGGIVTTTGALTLAATGGGITLNNANNVNTLTVTGAGGTVEFHNAAALNVGAIAAATRNVEITTNAGGITLTNNVTAGTLNLTSAGIINQTGGTVTTTGALTLSAGGIITLNNANDVNTLTVTNAGNNVNFTNDAALSVGAIPAAGRTVQITTTGSAHNITLTNAVAAGTLTLTSTGTITQTGGTVTTTGTLSLNAGGNITLNNSNNVNTLTVPNAGGDVSFTNDAALSVGAIAAGGHDVHITTTGSAHNITLTNAAAAGTLTLTSTGIINQTGGTITAGTLSLSSGGNITLNSANNSVGTLTVTGAGGDIGFTNLVNLALGAINAGNHDVTITGAADITVSGALSNAGSVIITSGNNRDINVNSGITSARLSLIAGSANNSTGIVHLGGTITVSSSSVSEGTAAAVYIKAGTLEGTSAINAANGIICVYLNNALSYTGTVTSSAGIHYHTTPGRNIAFTRSAVSESDLTSVYNITNYVRINADGIPSGDFNISTAGNIYIINLLTANGTRPLSFETTAGFIEFHGSSTLTGNLLLVSGNPIRLNNAQIIRNNNPFGSYNIMLSGTSTASEITASEITLGTVTGAGNSLTLTATSAAGDVHVNGTVGAATARLGDIEIANSNGNVTLEGAVYTSGGLSVTGSAVMFNGFVNAGGAVTVSSSATFTLSANINSVGAFLKTGTGNSDIGADIITTGTTGTITFNNILHPTANAVLRTTNSAININQAQGAHNLTLTSGTADINSGIVNMTGSLNVNSTGTATFTGTVSAGSFTMNAQGVSAGTAHFAGAQNYASNFTFYGEAVTAAAAMTVHGVTTMGNTGDFTLNVNSFFHGNYVTLNPTGVLTSANAIDITFGADVTLGNVSLANANSKIIFDHGRKVNYAPNGSFVSVVQETIHSFSVLASASANLQNVEVMRGNIVRFTSGAVVNQAAGRTLTLYEGAAATVDVDTDNDGIDDTTYTVNYKGAVLDTSAGSWYMGGAGGTREFAGVNGTLNLRGTQVRADRESVSSKLIAHNLNLTSGSFTVNNINSANNYAWAYLSAHGNADITDVIITAARLPYLIIEMDNPSSGVSQTLYTNRTLGSLHIGSHSHTRLDQNMSGNKITFRGEVMIFAEYYPAGLDAGDIDIIMLAGLTGARDHANWTHNGSTAVNYTRWEVYNVQTGSVEYPMPPFETNPNINNFVFRQDPDRKVAFEKDTLGASNYIYFEIAGNTMWQNFECKEPGAIIQFSRNPDHHTILRHFNITGDDNGGANNNGFVTITRLYEDDNYPYIATTGMVPPFTAAAGGSSSPGTSGTYNLPVYYPPMDLKNAVEAEQNKYWNINLVSDHELRPLINFKNVKIFFSHAYNNRIPIEREKMNLEVIPYYDKDKTMGYFNFDWIELRKILYSFTEDSDGNGRMDRIRVQTNISLNGIFDRFDVAVTGYEVDRSKGVNGFGMVPGAFNNDSFYIYLIENISGYDTGSAPMWSVTRNDDSLMDEMTRTAPVGDPKMDFDIVPFDTIPPRIAYTLTLPGHPQTFVQFSEPVEHIDLSSAFTGGGLTSAGAVETIPEHVFTWYYIDLENYKTPYYKKLNDSHLSYLLEWNKIFTLSDLAGIPEMANTPLSLGDGYFDVRNIMDQAQRALDWSDPHLDEAYYIYYQAPKYPLNWGYTEYARVFGNGHLTVVDAEFKPDEPLAAIDGNPGTDTIDIDLVFLPPFKLLSVDMMKSLEAGNGASIKPDSFASYSNPGDPDIVVRRITDALVSIPPGENVTRYFAWPVWARYQIAPNVPGYPILSNDHFWQWDITDTGIIWDFDGSKYLEAEAVEIQVRIGSGLTPGLELYASSVNVPAQERIPAEASARGRPIAGLWLPYTNPNSLLFSFAPVFGSGAVKVQPNLSVSSGSNYIFELDKNILPALTSGNKIEFVLKLTGIAAADLFAVRLDIPPNTAVPENWYRLVRPFGFDIQDIRPQRGGVTILNNVIYPDRGEITFLRYNLVRPGRVTIQVYTLEGTLVKSIRRNEFREAGDWTDGWDGTNNSGRAVARGMYFIRVVGPDIDEIRKVMVVR